MTIHIKNLNFSYKDNSIYQAFNAQIEQPGIYGLFGRNGSGKSTLLKLMAGLLKANAGTLDVFGFNPRQRLPDFLSSVYILPEEFHLPDLTPVQLGASHHHFYPNFRVALFHQYLDTLEIPKQQRFSQMSLGQKKKSAIAFALATCTPLLLMDEPTNGLDIVSREQFKKLMATEEQHNRIILISTHQAHDLESIINHIWFIDNGQLLLSASMQQLSLKLNMGIAENQQALPNEVVHQESMGDHIAWVGKNNSNTPSKLNVEMLYKALSLNQASIVRAVKQGEEATND